MVKTYMRFIIGVMIVFVFFLPSQEVAANQALTEPPPHDIGPFTVFDPNFYYLDDGNGSLSHLGDGEVNVWGQTLGTRVLDVIGVQVILQRWTGNDWIDIDTGPNVEYEDDAYAYSSREVHVATGYYYRVKTTHWIEHGDVDESGVRYSQWLFVTG